MKKYQGKNLEELLNKIASEKGVDVSEIVYEVIEEKKGILGIGTSVTINAYTNNDIKDFIFNYLGEYFTELNQAVKIEIIDQKDGFKVILDAENNAIVIGKAGQTLASINLVLRNCLNNIFKKRINVYIDVNSYKEERYKKLRAMARRIGKEVSSTKLDVELDHMSADERKVIHQYLTDFKHVKTESVGEGNNRHLVVKYVEEK